MNSFQNESHSGIKWIAPKSEHPKKLGSVPVSGKQPTYPSPNTTFCPKRDTNVDVELGERQVGSFPETLTDPKIKSCFCGMKWLEIVISIPHWNAKFIARLPPAFK